MKKQIIEKQKPSEGIRQKFKFQKVGMQGMKPLSHKEDGTPLKDWEYFELLGRKVQKLEEENKESKLPINYKELGYSKEVVEVAKTVCQAIDEKRPISEIEQYLRNSIDYEK